MLHGAQRKVFESFHLGRYALIQRAIKEMRQHVRQLILIVVQDKLEKRLAS